MDALALGLGLAVALLLVKEMGVPIPVPGDLIVLGAGAAVASGRESAILALALIVGATIAGGAIQFLLVRGAARPLVMGVLRRVGVGEARIEAAAERLRRRGATGVAVARSTPGVRIVAIAAAGIAALPFARFLAGLSAGNALFVGGHFALGYALGPTAGDLASRIGGIGVLVVGGIAVLAVVGWIGWRLIRRRSGRAATASTAEIATTGDWSDASCPACLLLGAVAARVAPVEPAPIAIR
jgi:membrane protein DedA with SNARE-associated domain